MTMRKEVAYNDCYILRSIEELVPENHLVRKLDKAISWDFIYKEVEGLYSATGRGSIDPVVLFKMIFINYMFGYNSMRKTCREIEVNIAYRWFLKISFEDEVPNYSTWSQNYIRRYGNTEIFEKIFNEILSQAVRKKMVKLETVFGDSTHQKANANKRKSENKQVAILQKKYEEELIKEINEERLAKGKKELKEIEHSELIFDSEGKEVEITGKRRDIAVSTTDPESGLYHKGEHEKCFAYSHQTFCDKNGFVLTSVTVPGNVHDSVSFFEAYEKLNEQFGEKIKNVCLDAGYNTSAICREINKRNQTAILPYHRPMTKKENFKKKEYIYDEESDSFICPAGCILKYTTTDRQGYRKYRCSGCEGCPLKENCTKSDAKILTMHIWERYRTDADKLRSSEEWKKIYPQRKQTIERVFADDKENHCLRFTRLKGLKKNQNQVLIIFACHNLKKMALWSAKSSQ